MQIIEGAAHPHFHAATQIDKRRGERYCSRDPNVPSFVKGLPLTDRRRSQGHTDQDCLIWGVNRSLLHFSWPRTKPCYGELRLLVRANYSAIVGRCTENFCQRRSKHPRARLRMANRSAVEGLLGFPMRQDERSAHSNIMDTSRSHRIRRNRNRPVSSPLQVITLRQPSVRSGKVAGLVPSPLQPKGWLDDLRPPKGTLHDLAQK